MRKDFNENINNIKNSGNYFFIKPFEVVSSYHSFIETWKIANKVYKKIDDVSDACLMQSYFDNAKFGYISYSTWKTKEAFIKSNLTNTVLKYHNAINGDGSKSVTQSLYKLISEEIYNKKNKKKKTLEIVIFENEFSKVDNAPLYWKLYFDNLKEKSGINSISLFQAIYKKTKFKYIGIIDRGDCKPIHNILLKPYKINGEGKKIGYKIYSSIYKIVKNIHKK